MKTRATVEIVNPRRGSLVLRAEDGHYVLAQQIDAKPLHEAQVLTGVVDTVGVEPLTDPTTGTTYDFFIEAYGLSRDAAFDSLR